MNITARLDPPPARRALWLAGLAFGLVLVCIPRFNRQDLFIDQFTTHGAPAREHLADAGYYMAHVQYFRGEVAGDALMQPFSYRPLVPWLASWLPFEPLTAINIVDLAAMLLTVLLLYRLLETLGFEFRWRVAGSALFVFSFPVFYYGPIGLVDPALVCAIAAGALLTLRDRWLPLMAVVVLGTLARETMIVILPVIGIRLLQKRAEVGWPKLIALCGIYGSLYLATSWLTRWLSPTVSDFVWVSTWDLFVTALTNPRVVLSGLLSFGLPGALALLLVYQLRRADVRAMAWPLAPLAAGFGTVMALYLYATTLGVVDGRHLWASYPFTVPLGVAALRQLARERVQIGQVAQN